MYKSWDGMDFPEHLQILSFQQKVGQAFFPQASLGVRYVEMKQGFGQDVP